MAIKCPSEVQSILDDAVAKLLVAVYGEKGYPVVGTRFNEIEDQGCVLGDALTRGLVQAAAVKQAAHVPASQCHCGAPLDDPTTEPHSILTRRGDVGWNEPAGHCAKCRRTFFPSEQSTGD